MKLRLQKITFCSLNIRSVNSLNPPKNLFGHHSGHQDLFKFIDHFEFISRFDERCVDANHTQSVRVKAGINNN